MKRANRNKKETEENNQSNDNSSEADNKAQEAESHTSNLSLSLMRQGWITLAVWMSFGLFLEGLLGYKTPAYLQDEIRRELFRLAHTHGTVLSLVILLAAYYINQRLAQPPKLAQVALKIGTVGMPIGFLVAGVWHYEGDPGLGIWLVPPSALLVIFGIVSMALRRS